jgi:hypothetical protein
MELSARLKPIKVTQQMKIEHNYFIPEVVVEFKTDEAAEDFATLVERELKMAAIYEIINGEVYLERLEANNKPALQKWYNDIRELARLKFPDTLVKTSGQLCEVLANYT